MKRILVPTDFSESAQNALQVAAALAKKHHAKIYLLHMMGISQSIINKAETENQAEAMFYMELARKRFSELLNQPYLKDIEVESVVQNYLVFSEINSFALEKNIDLIIMGSHGTGKLDDFFVGSNTEKVVRTADAPVLVIKDKASGMKLEKVVFACDFEKESMKAYKKAMQMFETLGSNVALLYVNLPNEKFMSTSEIDQKVQDFLAEAHKGEDKGLPEVNFVSDYTVENGIYQFSKKVGAQMIGIPTHGRKGLSHFFLGSLGEDLANHAHIPVMTFKI